MTVFYGGSSSLKVKEKDGHVVLRTRLLQNVILFLVVIVVLMIFLGVAWVMTQTGSLLHILVYFLGGYIVLSMLVMLTYTKVFDFDPGDKKLTKCTTIFGIGKRKVIDFDAMRSILLKQVSMPVAGSLYPFSTDMIECHLQLKSGDTVYVDRASEPAAMQGIAHQISSLVSIPIEEKLQADKE